MNSTRDAAIFVVGRTHITARGFTLIEIMVALAIVAVLGAISVIAYGEYTVKAKAVDIVTQYDALRTRAAAFLSNRSVEKCDDVQMVLNGRHPINSTHVALGYDFVEVADKTGYRPMLAVCGKADAGGDAVRVARAAHDSLARQAGAIENGAVLTESVVSFDLRLTEGDRAVCRTKVSASASPCDASAAARAQAQKAAYDQKKTELQAQQKKQSAQQSLEDKRKAAEQTRLAAEAARQEADRLAAEAAERLRLATEAARVAKLSQNAKQSLHKRAQEQEDARLAAAEAERIRLAAAAEAERTRLAAEAEQRRLDAAIAAQRHIEAEATRTELRDKDVRRRQCYMVDAGTGQPAQTGAVGFNVGSSPYNPATPIPENAPGSECVVCGDPNKGTPCSDLDLILAITAVCPDDKPYCHNTVTRTENTFTEYRRCVDAATVKADFFKNQNYPGSCAPGEIGDVNKHALGAECNVSCYGDLCNADTNPNAANGGFRMECK